MKLLKRLGLAVGLTLLPIAAFAQTGNCPAGSQQARLITGTSYTVGQTDDCQLLVFSSGSSITVNLPAPGTAGGFRPGYFTVQVQTIGAGTATVTPLAPSVPFGSPAPTINGTATLALTSGNGALISVGTNSNWYAIVGGGGAAFNPASPPPIGNVTPNTGKFTNLTVTGTCTGCLTVDPTQAYTWTALQTFSGGMSNITPATNVVGNIFFQQSTTNAPTTADSLFRPIYWSDILNTPSSGSSGGIHEHFFVETDTNFNGTFTQSGEYNGMHVFAKDINVSCANSTSCVRSGRLGGYEFSGTNDIDNTGSLTPFYDVFVNNASGSITLYQAFSSGPVNNGTIGTYAFLEYDGITGNQPTVANYSFLSKSTSAIFDHAGPMVVGVVGTTSGGSQLFIKGVGTGSGSDLLVKDSTNAIKFNLTDNGNLTLTGEVSGASNIRAIPIGLGAASTGAFTTLTANGTVNLNASNNAATNIGTGTTTSAVTIGGASNTTIVASVLLNTGITADTGHTDATVCEDTTTHQFYSGTGTLGVCLGTSSIRFKHDWRELSGLGLTQIQALKPGTFFYKKGYGDSGAHQQIGFLAEDVDKVIPKLVGRDSQGKPSSVDILGMVPVMVKAMQQQQAEIAELKEEVALLRRHRH